MPIKNLTFRKDKHNLNNQEDTIERVYQTNDFDVESISSLNDCCFLVFFSSIQAGRLKLRENYRFHTNKHQHERNQLSEVGNYELT